MSISRLFSIPYTDIPLPFYPLLYRSLCMSTCWSVCPSNYLFLSLSSLFSLSLSLSLSLACYLTLTPPHTLALYQAMVYLSLYIFISLYTYRFFFPSVPGLLQASTITRIQCLHLSVVLIKSPLDIVLPDNHRII